MIRKNNDSPPTLRCAIYTRKSTEEGLEQEFNTLDAQREAGEAYVASQKHEGWVCLPDRYDDGGFTGANMERPAVQRLMADVEAGRVDCIVVYKVDRLSRSLMDFAKIMDVLERRKVSFVSVTQQFNTSTSMGRLMLNVLLSFAQFEREIISERTRDKIAATRRKGKWSGGMPVLGYNVVERKLVVNEDEAQRVRGIFELYLEHESLLETAKELANRGWTTKHWTTGKGHERGGNQFAKNSLFKLLTNRIYLGQTVYKDEVHKGEHQAIVTGDVFEHVARMLKCNGRSGGIHVRNRLGATLKGLVRCKSCGCGMIPSYTMKKAKRYRYYVCANAQARGWHVCPSPSVPGPELERFVVEQIKTIGRDSELVADVLNESRRQREESLGKLEIERRTLEREIGRYAADIRKLAGQDGVATDRLADIQDRLGVAERRITEIDDQMVALSRGLVGVEEVTDACTQFDPLWETLTAKEQGRLLNLLVQRVEFDGQGGTVSITFHPSGIKTLAQEQKKQEATV